MEDLSEVKLNWVVPQRNLLKNEFERISCEFVGNCGIISLLNALSIVNGQETAYKYSDSQIFLANIEVGRLMAAYILGISVDEANELRKASAFAQIKVMTPKYAHKRADNDCCLDVVSKGSLKTAY